MGRAIKGTLLVNRKVLFLEILLGRKNDFLNLAIKSNAYTFYPFQELIIRKICHFVNAFLELYVCVLFLFLFSYAAFDHGIVFLNLGSFLQGQYRFGLQ